MYNMTLTFTELFLPHLLRESLQAWDDQSDDFILERPALLLVIIQYTRKLMPLLRLFKEIEEPCELLLSRGLDPTTGLVFLVSERLHEWGEIGIKVARFGSAEVRVDRFLRWPRENFLYG